MAVWLLWILYHHSENTPAGAGDHYKHNFYFGRPAPVMPAPPNLVLEDVILRGVLGEL
jgi:hypothetical protein